MILPTWCQAPSQMVPGTVNMAPQIQTQIIRLVIIIIGDYITSIAMHSPIQLLFSNLITPFSSRGLLI